MEDKDELNNDYGTPNDPNNNEYAMEDIPDEIMINIISYLDDTYNMINVNKNINNIYNSHNLYSYMTSIPKKYSR